MNTNLYEKACQFSRLVLCNFECDGATRTATKQNIEAADGRRKDNPISKKGSYVYAAYDAGGCLLYIGETGVSIKNRFITDGSGSHKETKIWYEYMETVKYKEIMDDKNYRKLLERALILAGNPKYQD